MEGQDLATVGAFISIRYDLEFVKMQGLGFWRLVVLSPFLLFCLSALGSDEKEVCGWECWLDLLFV